MNPVHFLPEGKHCYDVIEDDLADEAARPFCGSIDSILDVEDLKSCELFLKAAEIGEAGFVEKALDKSRNLILARDSDGYTALHRASYNGKIEVIKVLIANDANVSAKTDDGWQPLHCACRWNQIDVAQILLEKGADINAKTNSQLTPLHLASISEDNAKLLEMLLLNDLIDVNIKNSLGETAYDIALRHGPHYKLFELQEESINIKKYQHAVAK